MIACVQRKGAGSMVCLLPTRIRPMDNLGDTRLIEAAIAVVAFEDFEV